MREPARIYRITTKLWEIWSLVPDERFGQMLENYVYPATNFKTANGSRVSISIVNWAMEDDKLEKHLNKVYALLSKRMDKSAGKTARKLER